MSPTSASAEPLGSAGQVELAISRLKEIIRTKVEWQVRSEDGGIIIGYETEYEADAWLADHNKRFPDSIHGKCSVVRREWMPERNEDIRQVIGELLRLRLEVALLDFKLNEALHGVRQNDIAQRTAGRKGEE